MRFFVFFVVLSTAAQADDVLLRAQRAAFIPSLEIRFTHRDNGHAVWATLAWDFEDLIGPSRTLVAYEIERLQHEKELFIRQHADLAIEYDPAID